MLWSYTYGHPPPWIKSTVLSQISLNNLFFSGNFYFNDSFDTCNINLWLICYYYYCCFIEEKPDLRQVRWLTQHQKNQVFGFPNQYSCFSPEAKMSCLSSLKNSWSRKCQCQGWVWGTISMNSYSLPQYTAAVLSAKTGKCQPLLCNSRCISQEDRYPSSIEALKSTLGMVCWIFWARSPPGEIIRVIWKSFFKPTKSRDEGCVIRGATLFSKAVSPRLPMPSAHLSLIATGPNQELENILEERNLKGAQTPYRGVNKLKKKKKRKRRELVALISALLGLLGSCHFNGQWQCVRDECCSLQTDWTRMLERNPGGKKAGITCNLGPISGPIINYLCDLGEDTVPLLCSVSSSVQRSRWARWPQVF